MDTPVPAPRRATFAPSRRPARALTVPGTSPSTTSARACARHAGSTHRTPLLHGPTSPAGAPADGTGAERWATFRWRAASLTETVGGTPFTQHGDRAGEGAR
ncbi:DUF6380 family protein [Streptomyces viridiviolaceus]